MSVLAKNTYLGKLELIEVFEYYDKPILFACRNVTDQIYLVVLEDESDDYETWLYCPVSQTRFQQIRSGGIDLYSAFKLAENEFIFFVKIFTDSNINPEINTFPISQLTDAQLPAHGAFLEMNTQPIIDVQKFT